jgi:hypothetical protein
MYMYMYEVTRGLYMYLNIAGTAKTSTEGGGREVESEQKLADS